MTTIDYSAFANCAITSLTLPASLEEMGNSVFAGCANLTSVTISEGVKAMGDMVFYQCKNLTSIAIPNSMESMGTNVFDECTALTSAAIGNGVTAIGKQTFRECRSLTTVTLGSSVKTIGEEAFDDCYKLTSVNIPEGVTSIERSAFRGCTSLTIPQLPSTLTTIGIGAFSSCSGAVTIPASVTSIGKQAFKGCSDYAVESGNKVYDSRDNCHAIIETATNTLLYGCKASTFPSSVTAIGDYAFYGCKGITSITIPGTVKTIGQRAFDGCEDMTSLTLGDGVSTIGANAFDSYLETITCECRQVPAADTQAFPSRVRSLAMLYVPAASLEAYKSTAPWSSFTTIAGYDGEAAPVMGEFIIDGINYYVNTGFKTAEVRALPDGQKYTGGVVIPATITYNGTVCNVTAIGEGAFLRCSSLSSVTIPESVTSIGGSAFSVCTSLTSVTIPTSVTSIGREAFYYCSGLSSVTIPESVTSIGFSAFYGCSGLTSVTIPESVTSIGSSAFYGCSGLTSITIPASVTSIGVAAFSQCENLGTIVCLATNVPKASTNSGPAFDNNTFAKAILYVPEEAVQAYKTTEPWSSFRTILPLEDGKIPATTEVIIDGINYFVAPSIQTAEVRALPNKQKYTGNIVIPSTVTYDGVVCHVTTIAAEAFLNCKGITAVSIPSSVETIGERAFYQCEGLTSLTIPNSVTSIGERAFEASIGLTSLSVASGNTTYDSRDNCNAVIETATNTLVFGCQTSVIPSSVTAIGDRAFYGRTGLTTMSVPNSVKAIGNSAFSACTGLATVSIGEGVSTIGKSAFSYCTSLKDMICLAKNVPATDTYAFGGEYMHSTSSNKNATLHVPAASVDAYKAAVPWNDFKEIVAYDPAGVTDAQVQRLSVLADNGQITVAGVADGKTVNVYTLDGLLAGSATISGGRTTVATALPSGSIAIVQAGQQQVKVVVR